MVFSSTAVVVCIGFIVVSSTLAARSKSKRRRARDQNACGQHIIRSFWAFRSFCVEGFAILWFLEAVSWLVLDQTGSPQQADVKFGPIPILVLDLFVAGLSWTSSTRDALSNARQCGLRTRAQRHYTCYIFRERGRCARATDQLTEQSERSVVRLHHAGGVAAAGYVLLDRPAALERLGRDDGRRRVRRCDVVRARTAAVRGHE